MVHRIINSLIKAIHWHFGVLCQWPFIAEYFHFYSSNIPSIRKNTRLGIHFLISRQKRKYFILILCINCIIYTVAANMYLLFTEYLNILQLSYKKDSKIPVHLILFQRLIKFTVTVKTIMSSYCHLKSQR